jgi:phosphoglucomutase
MDALTRYSAWINSPALSDGERDELYAIAGDEKEIESRFYGQLEFGTAGLRGIMGAGINRMNIHVVRHVTQAFCEVISDDDTHAGEKCVAICFDSRLNSERFAKEAACVFAGNGISSRIFDALRPTPELSFAIREYGCIAGINITASHNTKEYNGYKAYWSDGAQLPPPKAAAVAEMMERLDVFTSVRRLPFDECVKSGKIVTMGDETDRLFMENVMAQVCDAECVKRVADTFTMVYTPFHGAGYKLVPQALRALGIKNLYCVEEQMVIDGTFPTVVSPNPEDPNGFRLAAELARRVGASFIVGTDPDSDRVGIMIAGENGDYVPITGNQTGVLLLDYLIGAKTRAGTMPQNPVALKTIVTTEMARRVAERSGVRCIDTFTGFKYMAERKNELESAGEGKVIFSYEESYGYMIGDYVRDKDAVTASLLLTEMAAWYASRGMTLRDALCALYEKYGYYDEKTLNLVMPGLDGLSRMTALMESLRRSPPRSINGVAVLGRRDYMTGQYTNALTGERSDIDLQGSDVLRFEMADGAVLLVRPSGTEPKIKVYILATGKTQRECERQLDEYTGWAQSLGGKRPAGVNGARELT